MGSALDRKAALGIFLVLSLVYWLGRSATFGPGDSPQHAMSALVWGVSKAPGYPLYTAAAHLFSKLAGGGPGAVNGFSGLLHAYAAALFFLLLRRQGPGLAASVVAVAILAFGRLYWFYSGVAEVRALNDLLALAAACAALTWSEYGLRSSLAAFAVLSGLGVSHHPTFALVLPALAWLACSGRTPPKPRDAALFAGLAAAACAAPYLLLWARLQVSEPAYNFEGARTLREVLALFLRESTGGPLKMFPREGALGFTEFSFAKLFAHARWFAEAAAADLGPAGLALGALGVWSARRCGRRWLAFWGLWLAGTASYFLLVSSQTFPAYDLAYARGTLARFYLLPLIALAAPAAFGAQWIGERARPAAVWALAAACALGPALLRPMGHRGRDALYAYMEQVLECSDSDDILLLVADDSLFAARYLDAVERRMEDRVVLVPAFFRAPRYEQELRRRHPSLAIPRDASGAISDDFRQWMTLNPSRRLFTEGALLASAKRMFPRAQARGVLIELTDAPRARPEVRAETERFLRMAGISRVDKWSVRDFTQEIYVSRVYRQMAVFHATLLRSPDDIDLLNRLESLFRSQ